MDLTVPLTTAAAVVALLAAAWTGTTAATGIYRRTLGSRRDLAARVDRVASGVTREYFESVFGAPAFRGGGPFGTTELVYASRHAWISTLDRDDAVVALSITVTDPKFSFRSERLTFDQFAVRVGRSLFAELPRPEGRMLSIGSRRFAYLEHFYVGNPGAYQHYLFGFNDAGTGTFRIPEGTDERTLGKPSGIFTQDPALRQEATCAEGDREVSTFRARTTVNTLTVFGPLTDEQMVTAWLGVDYDQVRVLRPSRR
jgi:hypothetical protein